MSNAIYNLAVDFGASSGRVILSKTEGDKITLEEIHRFSNDPVRVSKVFYWDIFRLYHELKIGLKKAAAKKVPIQSIGIDSWGIDYGLLDENDNLIGNSIHYRDNRTDGIIEESAAIVSLKEQYERTGIQFIKFNTLYQMMADKKMRPGIFEKAKTLLFIPDLFVFFLTGKKVCEYTIASTGQILDIKKRDFDYELLNKLGVRADLFAPLVMPGTIIGELTPEVAEETGLYGVRVIAVGEHDTASAVAGCPLEDEAAAYLSCGTWSLLGAEISQPIISENAFNYNFTNEGGVEGEIRLLKNIDGLWIIQNLKKNWCEFEYEVGYPEIIQAAREAKRKNYIIDPNDPRFLAPYNMVKEVIAYCEEHGQGTPKGLGEIAIAAYNGLTNEYNMTVQKLQAITGKQVSCLNMVGGGIQDELLCELTAKAIGKPVIAGPKEGSVLGNISMQLKALGYIQNKLEGRKIIKNSFIQKKYYP